MGNAFSLLGTPELILPAIAQEGKETKDAFWIIFLFSPPTYPTLAPRAVAMGWKTAEATQQVSYATQVLFPSLFVAKVGKLQVAQILSPAFPDTGGHRLQPLSISIRYREDPTGLRGPSPPKFIATEALTAPR